MAERAAIILATMAASLLWFSELESAVRKDYAKAGYIVIDKQAYRITPVEGSTRP